MFGVCCSSAPGSASGGCLYIWVSVIVVFGGPLGGDDDCMMVVLWIFGGEFWSSNRCLIISVAIEKDNGDGWGYGLRYG